MTAVLVVDDEPAMRGLMYRLLTGYGFHVRMAEDAREAWAALTLAPAEVVISDLRLPGGVNGCRLVREIVSRYPETRCLLMSGYPNDHLNRNLDTSIPLLEKPFTAGELFDRLTRLQLDPPWRPGVP